jgi:putative hydrolase of the HAD superfamily
VARSEDHSEVKALAFDLGHTLMDELRDRDVPMDVRPVHLMPGAAEVVPRMTLPLAVWANTRVAREADVRRWLDRAGLGGAVRWVITSIDAGARKPARAFFEFALARMACRASDVLFVGNQLNADVAGGEAFGIRTVWLSGAEYRSPDDTGSAIVPTYSIASLSELPPLLERLAVDRARIASRVG